MKLTRVPLPAFTPWMPFGLQGPCMFSFIVLILLLLKLYILGAYQMHFNFHHPYVCCPNCVPPCLALSQSVKRMPSELVQFQRWDLCALCCLLA